MYYNVYNQDEVGTDGRNTGRTTFHRVFIDAPTNPVPADMAAVIFGDFNEHHAWWQALRAAPRRQARDMVEWLREHNYTLANSFDEPTFASHATGAPSVLDLAFFNPAAGRLDAVYNFRVDAAASGASDHYALLWESPPSEDPIVNVTGCQFNWKKCDDEKFRELLRARLDETGAILRLVMDDAYMPTDDELERAAQCFQDALVLRPRDRRRCAARARTPSRGGARSSTK